MSIQAGREHTLTARGWPREIQRGFCVHGGENGEGNVHGDDDYEEEEEEDKGDDEKNVKEVEKR